MTEESLQAEVNKYVNKVEDEILSPIQGFAYKNASTCFQVGSNRRHRQTCVERALHPASQATDYFQQEINAISERVNRCAQTCHDDVMGYTQSPTEDQKAQVKACTDSCMERAKNALPEMMKKVRETLKPLLPPTSELTAGTLLEQPKPAAMPAIPGGIPDGLPSGMSTGIPNNLPNLGNLGS